MPPPEPVFGSGPRPDLSSSGRRTEATTRGMGAGDYSVYLLEDDSYESLAGGTFTVR
jgi:hypothetical protein